MRKAAKRRPRAKSPVQRKCGRKTQSTLLPPGTRNLLLAHLKAWEARQGYLVTSTFERQPWNKTEPVKP